VIVAINRLEPDHAVVRSHSKAVHFQRDQFALHNPALGRRFVRCVQLELCVPILWPCRQQNDLPPVDLHQHLLQSILAIASIVLIRHIVVPTLPERRKLQPRIPTCEIERDILLSLLAESQQRSLDRVLYPAPGGFDLPSPPCIERNIQVRSTKTYRRNG